MRDRESPVPCEAPLPSPFVASRCPPREGRKSTIYQLVAIAYPEQELAAEAAEELDRRGWDLLIDHDAVAAAVCDAVGEIRRADRRRPATAAGWRELWPALLATVSDGGEPAGIEPGFRDWLRGAMRPETSVVAAVVESSRRAEVLAILIALGGVSITSDLPDDFLRRWGIADGSTPEVGRA